MGLSPRVRGNQSSPKQSRLLCRSIPACTGKPALDCGTMWRRRVYPRVYGETNMEYVLHVPNLGLSPRVRGNHPGSLLDGLLYGSIPACTGKPWRVWQWIVWCGVYPRVYGETSSRIRRQVEEEGLSPRVRGNLPYARQHGGEHGSIPACTGKPIARHVSEMLFKVYPRVYGETTMLSQSACSYAGLSPRVRGNP